MNEANTPLSKGRLDSFSDGVFAIAITLLVLEVHLPANVDSHTITGQLAGLLNVGHQYAVYFVSFATIGIMWVNHHALFKNVRNVTHGLVLANLLLLALISFLPFPTEVLAQYGITSVAVVYYGLVMTLISIAYTICYLQILAAHDVPTGITPWSIVGLTFYPLASVIGYFAPIAGMATMGILALFYMHPKNIRTVVLAGPE